MKKLAFDGYAVTLPEGWSDVLEEGTYSDPDRPPPITFAKHEGIGVLYVTAIHYEDEDDAPAATTQAMEHEALEWGRRRGMQTPLAAASEARRDVVQASASYRVGDDFVQVWYVGNGGALLLEASYVCPWSARDDERLGRDMLVGSLRFR